MLAWCLKPPTKGDRSFTVSESFIQLAESVTVPEQDLTQNTEVTEAVQDRLTKPWIQQRHQKQNSSGKLSDSFGIDIQDAQQIGQLCGIVNS